MHVVNIYFIPWEIVVILFKNVSENIIEFLPICVLLLHAHILVKINYLGFALLGTFLLFFLVFHGNLGGVVMDFLVHFFVWKRSHQLQVFVWAYTGHLIIEIHLLYFYHFVHDLNKSEFTFFSWLRQSRWIVSMET